MEVKMDNILIYSIIIGLIIIAFTIIISQVVDKYTKTDYEICIDLCQDEDNYLVNSEVNTFEDICHCYYSNSIKTFKLNK